MGSLVLKRTGAPAVEPISTDEAKSQIRVDIADDNTLIDTEIAAAREFLEQAMRRAFITQTWRLSLSAWPAGNEIEIPRPPLQEVSSIVYTDSDGNPTTWSTEAYIVDTDSEPGRVVLAYGESWPSVTLSPANPIQITFVAGYGDAADDVPEFIKQAITLLLAHWYENREAISEGLLREIPLGVESLIWLDRVF
jgi:uncharacterized phiE125 gp8 family phage protein